MTTPDAIQEALEELTQLTACQCGPEWTERQRRRHARECLSEYRSDVITLGVALGRTAW